MCLIASSTLHSVSLALRSAGTVSMFLLAAMLYWKRREETTKNETPKSLPSGLTSQTCEDSSTYHRTLTPAIDRLPLL